MNLADGRADRSSGSTSHLPGDSGESSDQIVITIDGPAGTGKSSVARKVAERLGLFVLDTGAMYRAVAWLANRNSIDPADQEGLLQAMQKHPVKSQPEGDRTMVMVGDIDPGESLRSPDVEAIVSIVAALPMVRDRLVDAQRDFARRHPRLVTEGRDQGSVVFPDATSKFFLTASPEVRARRRVEQIVDNGGQADAQEIQRGIESRDRLDASRSEGPLVKPKGAVEIDTDALGLEAVVDRIVSVVQKSMHGMAGDHSEESGC